MVTCLGDLHIWSVKNQAVIQDGNIGCFTYHDKADGASPEHPYVEEKAAYTEGRNVTWTPRNKRPDKLRDSVKEIEELLTQHRCLKAKWLSRRMLQLILTNGIIISLAVSIHTGDIDKIFIDKSLVGKLSSDQPSDVLLTDSYITFVYWDKSRMDYFHFVRRPSGEKKIEKIASYEPKLLQVDLPGPVNRRLERKLTCNLHQDVIICWWPSTVGEAQPWSPMATDREKANLVLLTAIGSRFEVLTFSRTDCDPLGVIFSLLQPHHILTVEQWSGSGSEVNINNCVYEVSRNKVHKVSVTTISLRDTVSCYDRNLTEDKVLLGCSDGTIVLYDQYKKITQLMTASVIPHTIRWHPSGTIAAVTNARGELQVFDLALSPLKYQLVAENPEPVKTLQLAQYLRAPSALGTMQWSPLVDQPESRMAECNDSLFLLFERGPPVMLQLYIGVLSNGVLSPLALVTQYIKYRQIDQAIAILSGLNWNCEGQTCYACLSAIINHLLRDTLNAEREGQLESVLGTFYAPVRPLSEVTVLEYRDPISRLARRFFHHLLRFSRFEKAFLLAVDIGSRDLFMDIHYVARDRGETTLAEAALRKAQQAEAESLVYDRIEDDNDDDYTDDESEGSFTDSDTAEDVPQPPPRPPKPRLHPYMVSPGQYSRAPNPELGHSWQPPSQPWQPRLVDMSENVVRELEAELAAELVDEYTEALCDEPILAPPPSHGNQNNSSEGGAKSTVKVIHFGVV